MKVEVKKSLKNRGSIKFPILMRSKDLNQIVLFTSADAGIVLSVGKTDDIIHYSASWLTCYNSNVWEPFDGEITLSNN